MNKTTIENFARLKPVIFVLPILLLILIAVFLGSENALNQASYPQVQKEYFYEINHEWSQFPGLEHNLTQLGDTLVIMSLLTIFIMYAPRIWEDLITASLISAILSNILKKIFTMPRPAAVYDQDSFVIMGRTLTGSNSLPSGHSITIFATITIVMFAFMPKKMPRKILWFLSWIIVGLFLVSTRVGVGAHYPLDTIVGGIVGYISAVLGIFVNRKYNLWKWIRNPKYYPFFIVLFIVCSIILIVKISKENLPVFYFPLISLLVSLYIITRIYVRKVYTKK